MFHACLLAKYWTKRLCKFILVFVNSKFVYTKIVEENLFTQTFEKEQRYKILQNAVDTRYISYESYSHIYYRIDVFDPT